MTLPGFLLPLPLATIVSGLTPTATAPLIVNQGPDHRCYSWYAEGGPRAYPNISEWSCQYADHYRRFTLGTVNWPISNFRNSPGYDGQVIGNQGSPLTVALQNRASGADSCDNHEMAFTYDFPTQALYSNVNMLDLHQWDSVIIEFDVDVGPESNCSCRNGDAGYMCPSWTKAQFTTDILYWWGSEQHDTGDYNVISVRHLDNKDYGVFRYTNARPGEDHYGFRLQYTDHQALFGAKSHVRPDLKELIAKYHTQLCQGNGKDGPIIHLNSVQFVMINAGYDTSIQISHVTANALKYAPGDFKSSSVAPGCTPCNCPVQPTDRTSMCDASCSTTAAPSPPTPMPACPTPQTLYGQCGGNTWSGPDCCGNDAYCSSQNVYYSQCVTFSRPGDVVSDTMTTTTTAAATPSQATQTSFGQCGGKGFAGPTACPAGTSCQPQNGNVYYYQCLP